MVEYGCNVDNKFGFMSDDDEFDDPQELISHVTQLVAEKAAAQKKAEKLAKQAAALPKEPVKCAGEFFLCFVVSLQFVRINRPNE
ncbi:unnamed protein product [Heligmosomoides polygyrus]|uniref:Eukaryotic translation initiation factor 3 30 kDa subunit n=1 Tax=Heligmosomoides polygyrus TaxID=6339 RepID=A0A183FCA2_HELPZ|nr:unnamed protein product [Heligmosomoides polygyrus]